MRNRTRRLLAVLVALAAVMAACGDDSGGGSANGGDGESATLRVPDDYGTIQEAVDAADPGSLILISPGTYEEEVDVTTDDLVLRGLDRNEVVLDGGFERENGVRILEADGVVVENMTLQNYTRNGVFWTGVDGYRGSYLTAIRNGDYGIYAYGSVNGVLEHSYASGSPDAGFYIGQCYPCDALIRDVVSEWNGLGYSGTNAGGNLTIVESIFRMNRVGVVPNSGSYEGCAPGRETTIVGNLVVDNDNPDTDAIGFALLGQNNGILVAGGTGNVIERNRVEGHPTAGIALVPLPEEDPIAPIPDVPPDPCTEDAVPAADDVVAELDNPLLWPAIDNQVVGNVVSGSGIWDLALLTLDGEAHGNCFAGNEAEVTAPADIEQVLPCDGTPQTYEPETARFYEILEGDRPPPVPYEEVDLPDPGPYENMPDAETAPAQPAGPPPTVDLDAIEVPPPPG
jgi:Right handed beta helix region